MRKKSANYTENWKRERERKKSDTKRLKAVVDNLLYSVTFVHKVLGLVEIKYRSYQYSEEENKKEELKQEKNYFRL